MGTTSVRPENLQRFVSGSRSTENHLRDRIQALTASYRTFQATSGIDVSNADLIDRALPDLLRRFAETRTWTDLLREAVLAADTGGGDGTVTIGDADLHLAMVRAAQARGIDLDALSAPDAPIEIDPPTVGPIPQSSGYVDDPVCTATGHFLEDEIDLAMPERLRHLRWARRYSSRQLDAGGHGRGWFTWASARCTSDEGLVTVVCPEGRHVTFVEPAGDEVATTDGADVTLRRAGDGWALAWGSRSLDGPETWVFGADGRIERVVSPLRGDVEFQHAGGRLVGMRHQGGRSLALEWQDDRIVAVRASDGREVRYRYGSTGDLAEVERALGGRRYEADAEGRIVRVVDADGVVLCVNRYDELGRVARQVAATGRVSVFKYEPGRRTDLLDTTGRLLARYEHDLRGRVERFVTPSGAALERTFDADGCVVEQRAADGSWFVAEGDSGPGGELRITHGDGRVEVFRYDELGRVAEHETAGSEPVRLRYDGDSPLPVLVEGPLGWRLAFEWGPSGEQRSSTDADGVTVTWSHDAEGMPAGFTDPHGHQVRVARHPSGVVSRAELPDGGLLELDVDAAGRPRRIVDATGAATAFTYTPAGRVASVDRPGLGRLTFTYAPSGFLERITDATGAEQRFERDEFGRATRLETVDGSWRFAHSDLGVLTEVVTPSGATWRAELDVRHRLARVTDAGGTVELAYDDAGRLHRAAGPLTSFEAIFGRGTFPEVVEQRPGGRIELAWDERDRPVAVRDADGVETRYEWTPGNRLAAARSGAGDLERRYDETGALVAERGAGGGEWRIEHDWAGRDVATTSPEGRTTRIERDGAGRTVAFESGGATTRYAYDDRGRLVETTLPTGARATVTYDEADRPVEVGNPAGGRTRLTYDAAGRVVTEVDPLGGEVAFGRDADGNLVSRRDQLGRTTVLGRNGLGVVTSITRPDGATATWELDEAGRVAAVLAGDEVVARNAYGADGLLATVEEPGRGRTTELQRTPAGRLARLADGRVDVTYEREDGRVVRRVGSGLPDASWTHGPNRVDGTVAGRRVSIIADLDGSTREVRVGERSLLVSRDVHGRIVGAGGVTIGRDELGRVVEVTGPAGTVRTGYDDAGHLAWREGPDGRQEWRYDLLGRLVEERVGEEVRTYAYDAASQLVSVTDGDGTTTFTYDAAGRRVAEDGPRGTRRYEWDALGRLLAVEVGGERIEVDVDAFGLLRGVGATRIDWDHGGAEPVPAALDGRPLVTIGHRVVADGDRLILSGLLGPAAGPSPWGWAPEGPEVEVDCGIPGGLAFAGLVWLGARAYDPATRQFLTTDPLAGVLGSTTAGHAYHYADNDPLNRCDPDGRNGRPISIDDFNDMKDDATGFQWDNVGKVAVVVVGAAAMAALTASGVGLVGLAIAGGAIGASSAGINGLIDGKPGGDILRDMAIGGVLGAAGGAAGGVVSRAIPVPATLPGRIGLDAGSNAVTSVATEAADSYLPGGDGRMDWEKPLIDTVAGTAGSQLGGGLHGLHTGTPAPDVTPPSTMGGPSTSPLAPPSSTTLVLPNANAPRFPGSSLIDPNADLVRTPGGILLPPGVGLD